MPTLVACKSCGAKLKIPEGTTAKRVRCPGCGEAISLAATAITPTPEPKPRKKNEAIRVDRDEDVEVDLEVVGRKKSDDDEPRVRKKKRKRPPKEKEKKPADAIPLWLWGGLAGAGLLLFGIVSVVMIHAGYGLHLLGFAIAMAILLPVSIVILVVSMFAASALLGGVDFGQAHVAIPKAAVLLLVVNMIQMVPFAGPYIALGVWFFGLMGLFGLDWVEARVLVAINWGLNFVFRMFILGAIVSALVHADASGDRPGRGGVPRDRPAAVQQDEADDGEDAPPMQAPPRPLVRPR